MWWLLLCSSAITMVGAAAPAADKIPYWKGPGPINACTSEYTPMVYCTDRAPENYTGYEIELFRKVAQGLGWQPSMIKWRCLAWSELMQHLNSADGVCDIIVAGMDVDYKQAAEGVDFTWPAYKDGLSVLTLAHRQPQYNMWSFFSAFDWQVWVVTAATAIAVPFVVWAIDWFAYCWPSGKWPQGTTSDDVAISRYFWESITRPMWMRGQTAMSWAGNLVIAVYAFLVFILFALYVSYATTNLTSDILDSQVTGIESLPGKAVGTWDDYSDELRKKGVDAVTYKWDTLEDEENMLRQLKSGALTAIVLDSTSVRYMASADCELEVLGAQFAVTAQATAFRAGAASQQLLDAYNAALTKLINTGEVEELAAASLVPPDAPECSTSDPSTAIRFHQVAGLWVITGVCCVVAVVMVLVHILHVRYTRPILKPIVDRSMHNVRQRLGSLQADKASPNSQTAAADGSRNNNLQDQPQLAHQATGPVSGSKDAPSVAVGV